MQQFGWKGDVASARQWAKTYVVAGQPEKAIDTLEELLKVPYWASARSIAIDPNYERLRGNPRFQKLAGKS